MGRDGVVVAIDGPAGAGKSTLARRLAKALGVPFVNTGLMYRAVARHALDERVDPSDGPALGDLARGIVFGLSEAPVPSLLIDGAEPDLSLTSDDVEAIVSEVSRHPEVRAVLREAQRRLGEGGTVMEGRDIGTVVLPRADVKLFLSAPQEVRSGRRRQERGGAREAAAAVAARDALDALTNPLVAAPDAVVIDATTSSPKEVFERALHVVRSAAEADRR